MCSCSASFANVSHGQRFRYHFVLQLSYTVCRLNLPFGDRLSEGLEADFAFVLRLSTFHRAFHHQII